MYATPRFPLLSGPRIAVLILGLGACSSPPVTAPAAAAPRVEHIDLAALKPGSYTSPRGMPGIDSVVVENMVPAKSYNVSVDFVNRALAVLPNPSAGATPAPPQKFEGREGPTETARCAKAHDMLSRLPAALTEAAVMKQVAAIRSAIVEGAAGESCSGPPAGAIISEIDRQTTRRIALSSIAVDQDLVVTISRAADEPGSVFTWTNKYTGYDAGEWRTLFGFVFAPYVWPAYTYYSDAGANNTYTVSRRRQRDPMALIPSVQYIFHRATPDPWCRCNPTAGLGLDLTKPSVHAGLVWIYRENIGFSTGGVLHQVPELVDKYSVGQVLSTNLESDQLTRQVFHLDPYVSISFRFGSSPFSSQPTNKPGGK